MEKINIAPDVGGMYSTLVIANVKKNTNGFIS